LDIVTHISALLIGGAIVALIVILFIIFSKKDNNTENIDTEIPEIKITQEELDEQTYIQAQKEAKSIVVNRMAKKVERKITKGLFSDKASAAKNTREYPQKAKASVIDISEVKSILGENDTSGKSKKQAPQVNQSLAATQEFEQAELSNITKK